MSSLLPPNMFSKKKLPDEIPLKFFEIIEKVKNKKSKYLVLKVAYNELSKIYWGGNLNTIARIRAWYNCDIENISKKSGFLHCSNLNYLLRFILIKSGRFQEEDIVQKIHWEGHWFPHQYLKVKVSDNRIIDVDLWGKRYGIKFGDYVKKFPRRL